MERYGNVSSGYYWIQLNIPVLVYCDQETDGGKLLSLGRYTLLKIFTFFDFVCN